MNGLTGVESFDKFVVVFDDEVVDFIAVEVAVGEVFVDTDEEVVYQMTKALFENAEELTNAKKAYISAENAVKGIPVSAGDAEKGVTIGSFHPGALRYYKELGLIE